MSAQVKLLPEYFPRRQPNPLAMQISIKFRQFLPIPHYEQSNARIAFFGAACGAATQRAALAKPTRANMTLLTSPKRKTVCILTQKLRDDETLH